MQSLGLSFRKVEFIKNIATKIEANELDLIKLQLLTDEEVCLELSSLKGVGIWTAEMIMLFSMQRKNIVSYGDSAIIRGMRMLYHHRKITPEQFKKYKRRYTPYGFVASLYLWAIAGGAIPEMKDYAPKNNNIELFYLLTYLPDSNPDEYLNCDLNRIYQLNLLRKLMKILNKTFSIRTIFKFFQIEFWYHNNHYIRMLV